MESRPLTRWERWVSLPLYMLKFRIETRIAVWRAKRRKP